MLYDEHRKLGTEHATQGVPRYLWSDPHLQAAYDDGYMLIQKLKQSADDFMLKRQSIPGMPGLARQRY